MGAGMGHGTWMAAAACVLACGAAMAQDVAAPEPPPIPDRAAGDAFRAAPDPWRAYFSQAREAERLDDPLARCLAYPDLPGNRWPDGHAEAHCRYHAFRPLPLATVEGYLDRGELAALDAVFEALLAAHFSEAGSEEIHVAIEAFDQSEEAGRISGRWLELAPRSPYALLARANHYKDAAWDARGGKWASETPIEQMRRMGVLAEQAVPLFRRAIALEPRLMPAYVGLLSVAMLGSREHLEREAYRGAMAHDPACVDFARQRMASLAPRWGGDYERMLSFGVVLSRHVARRPQLAIHIAAPYGDRGNRLSHDNRFDRETADILEIAVRTGSNEDHLRDAGNVFLNLPEDQGGPDRWKGVALLLQEYRFNTTNAWAHRQIAWQLVRHEPEWALRHALAALALDADDASAHYLAGGGYYGSRRWEQAEVHFLRAADDATQRRGALSALGSMWMMHAGLEATEAATKAKPYVDRLLSEYPEEGLGWMLRILISSALDGRTDQESVNMFRKHADRSDPVQAQAVDSIEAAYRAAEGR